MTAIRILAGTIATIVAFNGYVVAPAAADWIAIAGANWKDGGGTARAAVGYSGIRSSDARGQGKRPDAVQFRGRQWLQNSRCLAGWLHLYRKRSLRREGRPRHRRDRRAGNEQMPGRSAQL
jgi:hypothetical protein